MSISNILKKLNSRDTQLFPCLPKINKKIKFVSIFVAFIFLGFVGHQIFAATDNTTAVEKYKNKQSAIDKGNNQESWMNESMMSNAMSINTAIAGTIPDSVLNGTATSWIPGGMIGFTNQAIASLYNPPASGVQYIAQSVNNFLGKPVYADNGYQGLMGIMPLWKSFRNTIYTLFSVIFVGIGIAIMLRIKISPQAVITIQSAIPKLITSLILVTFSYAIAGLLIDLSYIIQGLFLAILFNSSGNGINGSLFSGDLVNPSFTQLMNAGFLDVTGLTFKAVPIGALTLIAGIPSAIIAGLIAGVTGIPTLGAGAVVGIVVGALAFILIFLIILIMILVNIIKFFFGMIKCYINIILRIILAPLEIGIGAIPNMKMGFGSWILNLVANLAVFPISIIFLVLVNIIIKSINTSNLWSPPTLLGLGTSVLGAAIGLGALMLLSKLPTMIPEFIFQIKPSPFGKAIGEGVAGVGKTSLWGVKQGTDVGLNRLDSAVGATAGKSGPVADFITKTTKSWNTYREKGPKR